MTFLLKDIISRDFYCPPLYIVCIAKCEAVRLFIEEVLVSQRCSAHGVLLNVGHLVIQNS